MAGTLQPRIGLRFGCGWRCWRRRSAAGGRNEIAICTAVLAILCLSSVQHDHGNKGWSISGMGASASRCLLDINRTRAVPGYGRHPLLRDLEHALLLGPRHFQLFSVDVRGGKRMALPLSSNLLGGAGGIKGAESPYMVRNYCLMAALSRSISQ